MENIGTKSVNMSNYFFSLGFPLELGSFLISEDPPNCELVPTETWDFFVFLMTPVSQISTLFSLEASLSKLQGKVVTHSQEPVWWRILIVECNHFRSKLHLKWLHIPQ